MDDDDNAADNHTVAADDIGATTVAPPSTDAAPELAWSLDDDDEIVSVERQSWALAWAQAAVFASVGAVFALVIGAVGWATDAGTRRLAAGGAGCTAGGRGYADDPPRGADSGRRAVDGHR